MRGDPVRGLRRDLPGPVRLALTLALTLTRTLAGMWGWLVGGLAQWALAAADVRWGVAERVGWLGLVTPPAHPHP